MSERRPITGQEVLAGRDSPAGSPTPGGWTKERLAEWGVPWLPPAFWMHHLIEHGVPYMVVHDGSDDVQQSPYQKRR